MTTNKELLAKADMVVADLSNNGGLLNPEQANAFIRKLLIQPTLLAQCRKVLMLSPTRKINKIQFASRILHSAAADAPVGSALSSGNRSKPTTEQITLTTSEVIAEVRIPYDVIEDNIEGGNIGNKQDVGGTAASGGIRDTIMTLIAQRAALDLEELALLGDTTSGDTYLAMMDGFIKQISSNTVDAGGSVISRTILKNGMKTMPVQYRRNRASMKHFLSTENEIEYRDTLANRETSYGDALVQGVQPVYGSGAPVEGVGLMPASKGILTDPMNFIFGVQRDISVETDKDIKARQYIIVLTARIALKIEEELATVKYVNLG
jgi:hypothetical protein